MAGARVVPRRRRPDEADPTVRPLQPHKVAGLDRLRILPDRDHLAAVEPGGDAAWHILRHLCARPGAARRRAAGSW